MKTYSIGRDINCDIVINDSTDVVSRRHAIINVTSTGRMTIIDQSSNGTYVNGIRISSNVPVPVSRKDTVSLAHVAKLDWSQVPKSNMLYQYGLFGIIGLFLIACAAFGVRQIVDSKGKKDDVVVAITSDSIEKVKKHQLDSIAKAIRADSIRRDSLERIEKAKTDSISKAKKNKKKDTKKKESDKKKEGPKTPSKPKQDVG